MSNESRRTSRSAAREGRSTTGSTGPSGSPRAGRRERQRRYEQRPFLERYRIVLIGAVVVAIAAVAAGLVLTGATQASYTCSQQWEPSPTPPPAPDATPRLGYVQPQTDAVHNVSRPQRYTFCPPATGRHYAVQGVGPIGPRVYGPDANVGPVNWLHDMEHGAIVILYRGDSEGATDAGQSRFRDFFDAFPNSPICNVPKGSVSPIIARFDAMQWPYAALVWGRVLPLPEWDPDLVLEFYATESERLDADGAFVAPPEAACPAPSRSPSAAPSASPSPAASGSAAPSGSPAASGSAAPSASPSASPVAS